MLAIAILKHHHLMSMNIFLQLVHSLLILNVSRSEHRIASPSYSLSLLWFHLSLPQAYKTSAISFRAPTENYTICIVPQSPECIEDVSFQIDILTTVPLIPSITASSYACSFHHCRQPITGYNMLSKYGKSQWNTGHAENKPVLASNR